MSILFLIILCFHANGKMIKVGLGDFERLPIRLDSRAFVYSGNRKVMTLNPGRYYATAARDVVKINKRKIDKTIKIVSRTPVKVKDKRYRGNIILMACLKEVRLINELPIEEYLYGVVPCEMPWNWHTEALKAQAVIARTFAIYNFNKHSSEGFNLCNKICCQVYGGLSAEFKRVNICVDSTRGEILTFKGSPIPAMYHSCCGGLTESSQDAWGTSFPCLTNVNCIYCQKSPHFYWERFIKKEQILGTLEKMGYKVEDFREFTIEGYTNSGRAKVFVIDGDIKVSASKFRDVLSPFILKSTKIEKLSLTPEGIEVVGYGWGHGVGLCQWGANGLARQGKGYKEILDFYYPGTKVEVPAR